MMIPIYLFWNYLSPFPWWLGPALQITGILLLWSTRHTSRFYPKFGKVYYLFSSIARPAGIVLIAWGWLEIFSVQPDFYLPKIIQDYHSFLALPFLIVFIFFIAADRFLAKFTALVLLLCLFPMFAIACATGGQMVGPNIYLPRVSLALSLAFAFWSIFSLGLRRSFLYGKIDDQLVTGGAYKYFRHPQLLAAIFITLTGIATLSQGYWDKRSVSFQLLNALVLILGLYFISIGEDTDLEKRFGPGFLEFKTKVPGFFSRKKDETFKKNAIKWQKVLGLVFPAYLAAILFIPIFPTSGRETQIIFSAFDFRKWDHSYWPVGRKVLERMAEKTAEKKGEARKNLEGLDSYPMSFLNCPVTIFMCGQSQIISKFPSDATNPGRKNPRRRLQPPNAVTTLPFDLECSDHKIEIAAAYNCDYDDFAHIAVIVVKGDDTGDTRYYDKSLIAADDYADKFAPEFIPRMKQNSSPR